MIIFFKIQIKKSAAKILPLVCFSRNQMLKGKLIGECFNYDHNERRSRQAQSGDLK